MTETKAAGRRPRLQRDVLAQTYQTYQPYLKYLDVPLRRLLMRYLRGEPQRKLGVRLGISQAAVSHLLKKAVEKLDFYAQWAGRDLDLAQVRRDLGALKLDAQIATLYLRHGNQLLVADLLKISQGLVNYRLKKTIKVLLSYESEPYLSYGKALEQLKNARSRVGAKQIRGGKQWSVRQQALGSKHLSSLLRRNVWAQTHK